MQIKNDWNIVDGVSGLKLKVIPGKGLDRLHVESIDPERPMNRDFWFTKEGEFDGTGSELYEGKVADDAKTDTP